jgi:hypothetical protein
MVDDDDDDDNDSNKIITETAITNTHAACVRPAGEWNTPKPHNT